jgi:hypothetical protein
MAEEIRNPNAPEKHYTQDDAHLVRGLGSPYSPVPRPVVYLWRPNEAFSLATPGEPDQQGSAGDYLANENGSLFIVTADQASEHFELAR